jgi:protein-disulfide isomerase
MAPPPELLMEELAATPEPEEPAPRPRRLRTVTTIAAASAGVLVFALAFFMAGFAAHAILDDDEGGGALAAADISAADDPSWGPEDASVTIEAFSDFQCPYCKKFAEQTLPRLKEEYGDRVQFIFRDLPLTSIHPVAALAAQASGCAHDQGKFWEYHDLIYANQATLSEAALNDYAGQVGMDVSQFNDCLSSQHKMADVLLDMQYAQRHGVTSTPAFIINGVLISGAQPFELFAAVIDQSLEAQ